MCKSLNDDPVTMRVLKELLLAELSRFGKIEEGILFTECDGDAEKLPDKALRAMSNDRYPRDIFYDQLREWYLDACDETSNQIVDAVIASQPVALFIEEHELDVDEVHTLVYELICVDPPYKQYLERCTLNINIMIDTGDGNYDFVSNDIGGHYNAVDDGIGEEASLLWLARQQGYTKSQLRACFRAEGKSESKLLHSIYQETLNCTTHMNALVFLVQMTLGEWLDVLEAQKKEEELNKSYYLSERKGRGYLMLDAQTTCGLLDVWNGAGGIMEISLEAPVRLPFRCIDSIWPDGVRGSYGVHSIYGVGECWWDTSLRAVKGMKTKKEKAK